MRIVTMLAALGIFSLGIATSAMATDQTANASVTIRIPITITKTADLDFGTVTVSSNSSLDIDLDTDGNVTGTNVTGSQTGTPGGFTINGSPQQFISINLAGSSDPSNVNSDTLSFNSFSHDGGATPVLDDNGELILKVGANLVSAAVIEGGTYTGSFTLTVDYN